MIRSVALLLGPDYSSDVITVETSDHACLQLTLAYHWHFEVDKVSFFLNIDIISIVC